MTRSTFKVMTALFAVTPCFSLALPLAAAGITEPGPIVVWLPAANGAVPPNAIIGGNEPGRTLPVCRAIYNKGVHPGKVVGKNCNFGYGGKELLAPQYDVLVGNPAVLNKTPQLVRWIAAQGGQVPPGAFFGAYEPGRPILPICQAPYQGGVHVGKVVGRNCNFGYGGLEVLSPQYAVLVVGKNPVVSATGTGPVAIASAQNQTMEAITAAVQAEVLVLTAKPAASAQPAPTPAVQSTVPVPAAKPAASVQPAPTPAVQSKVPVPAAKPTTSPPHMSSMREPPYMSSMSAYQGLDLESMLMAVQGNRANELDEQIKSQMRAVQARNASITALNTQLGALKSAKLNTTDPATIAKLDAQIQDIKTQIDSASNTQQMEMLRLQSLSQKRNEAFELMTNFMKKFADSRSEIISTR